MQAAVQEFAESDFYEIKTELDYRKRVVGRAVNVKTPGPEFGALIGDCVHCLRSALDQLAYQLALSHTDPLPESWAKSSAFPIFETGPLFRGEKKGRRGAAHKMRGMSPSTRRTIERLQPYHRKTNPLLHALWQLEELSNLDKHRLLPLTGAVPAQGSVSIKFNTGGVTAVGHAIFPGPMEERRRMIGVMAENVRSADDLELDLEIKPFVAFDRRAEPASVRGWPLHAVIDGIFGVLGLLVFPALRQELHSAFGEGVALTFQEPQDMPGNT
jgi:hypothetical protein